MVVGKVIVVRGDGYVWDIVLVGYKKRGEVRRETPQQKHLASGVFVEWLYHF